MTNTKPLRTSAAIVAAVLLAAILLILQGTKPAEAGIRGVLDANCRGPYTWNAGFSEDGSYKAQTFTAEHTGKLTDARVKLQRFDNAKGSVEVQIRPLDSSGAPSSTVLASTTISRSAVGWPFSFETARFDPASAASVVAGQDYALVTKARFGYYMAGTDASNCAGDAYHAPRSGTPFTKDTIMDFFFKVYVVPE